MAKNDSEQTPKAPVAPVQLLQAFLTEHNLTAVPTITRIDPAGPGRYLFEIGIAVEPKPEAK